MNSAGSGFNQLRCNRVRKTSKKEEQLSEEKNDLRRQQFAHFDRRQLSIIDVEIIVCAKTGNVAMKESSWHRRG